MSSPAGLNERQTACFAAVAAALFYLCFYSYFYNFDGVACAVAVEAADWRHLVHSNHLLYGVVGWAFFSLWRLLGYRGEALLSLQVLDSLLGAASIGLFYLALGAARLDRRLRLGACAGVAVSYAFWLWSLEPQVYMLGAVFAAAALGEALREQPRPERLAALQACAMLGHVGHMMLAPVALFSLPRSQWARYAAWLAGLLAAAYAVVIPAFVRPDSLESLRFWALGSAALNLDKKFAWHGGYSLEGLRQWALTSARIVSEQPALAALCLAAAAAGLFAARRERPARVAGVWLASYFALFWSWEPHTMVYRITDLFALWLLAALAADRWKLRWAPAALAAVLAWTNYSRSIAPKTDPASNQDYQEAVWLRTAAPEDAWVVATSQGQVYVPYFSHRKPLNLRYWDYRLDELGSRLDELAAAGQRVFITRRTLEAGPWKDWFERYGLREEASRDGDALYEVSRKNGKPSGKIKNKLTTAPALKNGPNGIGSERLTLPRAINAKP